MTSYTLLKSVKVTGQGIMGSKQSVGLSLHTANPPVQKPSDFEVGTILDVDEDQFVIGKSYVPGSTFETYYFLAIFELLQLVY